MRASLTHEGDTLNISQQIAEVEDIANAVEHRLLLAVKEGAQRAVPQADLAGQLSLLADETKRCYQKLAELQERRDLAFRELTELQKIDRHCIWLYRRVQVERFFFRKWQLEAQLQELTSPEAFAVYTEILDLEGQERDFLVRGDAEIRRLLLEETPEPAA